MLLGRRLEPDRKSTSEGGIGFTLIELLVVIAIVAILAALLFPVFHAAKGRGQQSSCANNMRQVTTALLDYADDWNNFLPGLNAFGNLVDTRMGLRKGPLWKYVKSTGVFACPVVRLARKSPTTNIDYVMNFTYTINGYMTTAEDNRSNANTVGVSLGKSRRPTQTILLVDENCDERRNEKCIIVNDALFIWQDRTGDRHPGGSGRTIYVNGRPLMVEGVANVCYLDSHTGVVPGLVKWDDPNGQALFYH